jgi:hypothetical protein
VDAKPGTREVACGHTEPGQPQDFALCGQRKRKIGIPETWPWAPTASSTSPAPANWPGRRSASRWTSSPAPSP